MKTLSTIVVVLCVLMCWTNAQTTVPVFPATNAINGPTAPSETPYTVVERGANHRVWQKTTYEILPDGRWVPHLHKYTELATGLHYRKCGRWVESKEEIELFPQGAIARQGQYQVIFANNLNTAGAIDMQTSDGKRLRSNVLGLGYFDRSTGNGVLIAQLQDSDGKLIASNQILYPDAFAGVKGDVRYTYRKGRFEQDVILREQLPAPEVYGLEPDTTELEVITEFINPPPAKVEARKTRNEVPKDETISWGPTRIGQGRAFDLSEQQNLRSRVPTSKQFITVQGRAFLLEKVAVKDIRSGLKNLPARAGTKSTRPAVVSRQRLLPKAPLAQAAKKPIKRALFSSSNQGYVLDYVEEFGGGPSTLRGDTTYYVSGACNWIVDVLTIEGGTVVKFATNGSILCDLTSCSCRTGPYHPAIFTAVDDDTVGERIPCSTGTPSGFYALGDANHFEGIAIGDNITLHDLRLKYMDEAFGDIEYPTKFQNIQFSQCRVAILENGGWAQLDNCLFSDVNCVFTCGDGGGIGGSATHLTVHHCDQLSDGYGSWGTSLYLTNCLFVSVSNLVKGRAAPFITNSCVWLTNDPGVFMTVGAGSHYLADDTYRNKGTTNISSAVRDKLRQKTTYAPIIYSNITFSAATSFSPQAQRDTNALPDLGYHYDPIDYFFGGVLANSNITFTAGTAVGWFYNWPDNGYGISLGDGVGAFFNGTAASPCIFARYNTVQEGGTGNWTSQGWLAGITGQDYDNATPTVTARFTRCYMPNNEGNVFRDDKIFFNISAVNCEFYSGSADGYYASENFANCLFVNTAPGLWWDYDEAGLVLQGCTFIRGCLAVDHVSGSTWPVTIVDCAFDGTSIYMNAHGLSTNGAYCDYNAFLCGTDRTTVEGSHDLTIFVDSDNNRVGYNWQTNQMGDYYLPSDSPLINKGFTNANLLGLYYFTTQTCQAWETNSMVDIGYHYVAVDANGFPIDSNLDGFPRLH